MGVYYFEVINNTKNKLIGENNCSCGGTVKWTKIHVFAQGFMTVFMCNKCTKDYIND